MTAIEVALLLIGVVFILGSFFVMEKLSPTELSRVAELSEEELRIIMDRELETAGAKISDMADQAVDLSMNQIQRKMEKDTNEKIMATSEYSDTVMEKLQKINNEVTFLYSMLGDKHTEIKECMTQLNDLVLECQTAQEQARTALHQYQELQIQPIADIHSAELDQTADESEQVNPAEASDIQNDTEMGKSLDEDSSIQIRTEILDRYHSGEDLRDVARDLGLGYGEVKLIVELYKGEENQ